MQFEGEATLGVGDGLRSIQSRQKVLKCVWEFCRLGSGCCPDRDHPRCSHIADAHGLQRAGPLGATRRAREGRKLEDIAHGEQDRGGGPGDGRNALSLFHARNRRPS